MSEIAKILLPFGGGNNKPEMIVLHGMGQYIHVNQALKDYYANQNKIIELDRDYHAPEWLRAIKLSAHQLVEPSGMRIKCREDNQMAWHARGFNTNSLGVEFLAEGIHTYDTFLKMIKTDWLTENQFKEGIGLVRYWMNAYNIQLDRVKTHHELSPNRKADPGSGFTLEEFKSEL